MPHPDILRVLDMTAQEWGKLPFHDDTRQRLKEKAIAILKGDDIPIVNASAKAIAIHEATTAAEASGNVSRAGFEQAMIQQAKMFGEAVEQLRSMHVDLRSELATLREAIKTDLHSFDDQLQEIKDFHSSIVDQVKVMEDSRADYTGIIEQRCKTLTDTVNAFDERFKALESKTVS